MSTTIDELAEKIRHHRELYYRGVPEISDEEFDALEDRLRDLEPDHPVLAEVGAPPEAGELEAPVAPASEVPLDEARRQLRAASDRWFASLVPVTDRERKEYKAVYLGLRARAARDPLFDRVVPAEGLDWPKAQHEIPMGSLNKVNSEEELREWAERCDALAAAAELPPISGALFVTEKLDGLSLEVLYQDGEVEAAITRGDGQLGERITPNVVRMQGVPQRIEAKGRLSVRGEIVLRKSDAPRVAELKAQVDKEFTVLSSLRNTAAGLARAKLPQFVPAVKHLTALFYDVEGAEGIPREQDKIEMLKRLGFATPSTGAGGVDAVLEMFRRYAGGARAALDYEIDGLVVRADDIRVATLLGDLHHRPRAAVALKFGHEMQVSKLNHIRWDTGPSGRIVPVGEVSPVFLAGAQVVQASLHNLSNVKRLGIGVGDEVLVSRRNDVIPYIEKVVVKGPNHEQAPTTCAACNGPITVDGEYLVCRNAGCPAIGIGRLRVWTQRLDLIDWGEKTLIRLYTEGLAKEPADLYRLTVERLTQLKGFGEKTAERLLGPLNERKKIPLPIFIAALSIESVSLETGKLLAGAGLDTIEKILAATPEQLTEIPGIGAIKAEKILAGLRSRVEEIARLAEVGVVPIAPTEGGPLAGLSFCFSGAHSRPRKVLEGLVSDNGGKVSSSVTKGLTYLVLNDANSTSSKAEKAKKLGTAVIDEPAFEAILKERGVSV